MLESEVFVVRIVAVSITIIALINLLSRKTAAYRNESEYMCRGRGLISGIRDMN